MKVVGMDPVIGASRRPEAAFSVGGRRLSTLALLFSVFTGSCIDMAQEPVEFPLLVAGTAKVQVDLPDGQIELSEAQVAFGPLYLCAGASSGDLCDVARAQWLDTAVVDMLDPTPVAVGQVQGTSGAVLSWMYDLGISSQLSQSKPFVLQAAQRLGGVSLRLKGRARVEGLEIPFSAAVAVQQTEDTELGIPVVRKSVSDRFFRDLGATQDQLLVRFDPAALFLTLDLKTLVQRDQCTADRSGVVCDRTLARSCQAGVETSVVDCAAQGLVCAPERGCVPELEIEASSEVYRVLRASMLSGARPSMEWSVVPSESAVSRNRDR